MTNRREFMKSAMAAGAATAEKPLKVCVFADRLIAPVIKSADFTLNFA